MQIIYPYNEILPKKKAHDVYIVHECAALQASGFDVTLFVGKGSKKTDLFAHYNITKLKIEEFPIIRKNNPLGVTWNLPFFRACQKKIHQMRPEWVLLSVKKQAAYHLARKIPGVRYLYEVHDLCYYPNQAPTKDFEIEKKFLSQADLITVTTQALKEILLQKPYALTVPIHVVPLAVQATALPPPQEAPLVLMYVGQLYEGQGLPFLLQALAQTQNVHLKIIGGKPEQIAALQLLSAQLNISARVHFLGFIPPKELHNHVQEAHAFVAPFENTGRMPFVAHTKLLEYAEWGRPILAPRLQIVEEHFQHEKGALLFEPDSIDSLAHSISLLTKKPLLDNLQREISSYSGRFSWTRRISTYKSLLY